MIKVFFLIFEPGVIWDRIATARKGFAFILGVYLLPIIIISSLVEGWGLHRWGKWQPRYQKFRAFTLRDIITFEIIQTGLLLALVFVSALLLLRLSQTFDNRRSYLCAFTTMAYGYSPLFLLHLLDTGPMMSPWLSALIGILLTAWVLYQGIPRVLQPNPTHAFGLYLSAMFLVVLTAGFTRTLTGLFLLGELDYRNSWFTHNFPGLFQ